MGRQFTRGWFSGGKFTEGAILLIPKDKDFSFSRFSFSATLLFHCRIFVTCLEKVNVVLLDKNKLPLLIIPKDEKFSLKVLHFLRKLPSLIHLISFQISSGFLMFWGGEESDQWLEMGQTIWLFHDGGQCHVGTSPLICSSKELIF